jgi:hypothetical protein
VTTLQTADNHKPVVKFHLTTIRLTMSMILQFAPFQSTVEAPFWHALSKTKLNVLQLSEDDTNIAGFYASGQSIIDSTSNKVVEMAPRLSVSNESLEITPEEAFRK